MPEASQEAGGVGGARVGAGERLSGEADRAPGPASRLLLPSLWLPEAREEQREGTGSPETSEAEEKRFRFTL